MLGRWIKLQQKHTTTPSLTNPKTTMIGNSGINFEYLPLFKEVPQFKTKTIEVIFHIWKEIGK